MNRQSSVFLRLSQPPGGNDLKESVLFRFALFWTDTPQNRRYGFLRERYNSQRCRRRRTSSPTVLVNSTTAALLALYSGECPCSSPRCRPWKRC